VPTQKSGFKRAVRPYIREAERIDDAVYGALAGTSTPRLDYLMRHLSSAANYSRINLACAAVLASAGGATGRRAAASGLASVAVTSAVVNVVLKQIGRRRRPNPRPGLLPMARRIAMPTSPSFPSGHTASAVAFAAGAGRVSTAASLPLHVLAALVGYSRVHTGVHYPSDVVAGALTGTAVADLTAGLVDRITERAGMTGARPPRASAASVPQADTISH
jgi:membrane-associated phospholipid phosphatase